MTKPVGLEVDGFCRFRIDFGYDGTDFSGFVKQPDLRTVQGELLRALEVVFGTDSQDYGMRVAGRTDAGVHAEYQVVHIDIPLEKLDRVRELDQLAGKLNSLLPQDLIVYQVVRAPAGFDARFSASYREYCYRIADRESFWTPLESRYLLEVPLSLDIRLMRKAAAKLRGLHDFAAFCKPREGATTIRNLKRLRVRRVSSGILEVSLRADAFCHNMVRSIVGALIACGSKKATVAEIASRLDSRSREGSFKVVEPKGLSLVTVGYPAPRNLAKQAEKARNRRTIEEI